MADRFRALQKTDCLDGSRNKRGRYGCSCCRREPDLNKFKKSSRKRSRHRLRQFDIENDFECDFRAERLREKIEVHPDQEIIDEIDHAVDRQNYQDWLDEGAMGQDLDWMNHNSNNEIETNRRQKENSRQQDAYWDGFSYNEWYAQYDETDRILERRYG